MKTIYGEAPLSISTWKNKREITMKLLEYGAELNDFDGLQEIVVRGQLAIMKVLIKHGVDLNRYTQSHCVPLHYAIGKNNIEKWCKS